MKKNKQLVPKRRFKEFENDGEWGKYKLGELSTIVRGASPRPIQNPKWFDSNSDVGWLRIADVTKQDGRIYYLEQKLSEAGQEKTRVLKTPHLLLSIAATVGKPVINYVNTGVHDGFLIFLNPIFDQEFMFQWLEMFREKWQKYGQPGSQVNLNSELVRNQDAVIPTIEEQNKIGSYFEELDKMLKLQQRKLKKIHNLKKSYLSDMFPKDGEKYPKKRFEGFTEPWERNDIEFFAGRYDNLRVPVTASNRTPGKTPYYGANGIQDFVEGFTHDGEYILIAEDGANDLKDYPVHYVNGKVWVNNHAHVLQAKEGVADNKFLMYVLKTIDMEPYLVGGGRAKLNANIMMDINISVPSIKEQKRISEFFFKIDKQINLEEQKLNKLEQLKQAYLNELLV